MRIVLVDDHRVFMDSLQIALTTRDPDLEVVGQSARGGAAIQLAERLQPDLMVLDLLLDDTDAVTVTRELRQHELATNVLVLSIHENALFVRDSLAAGAQGYALKGQPLDEIVEAVKVVGTGGRYLAPT